MDERFKNAGKLVWVWDDDKKDALVKQVLFQYDNGLTWCIDVEGALGHTVEPIPYINHSFTEPNKVEYESYGDGEMPQLEWVVNKVTGSKFLITGYAKSGRHQLCINGAWKSNYDVFEFYTDINGNHIGKEK